MLLKVMMMMVRGLRIYGRKQLEALRWRPTWGSWGALHDEGWMLYLLYFLFYIALVFLSLFLLYFSCISSCISCYVMYFSCISFHISSCKTSCISSSISCYTMRTSCISSQVSHPLYFLHLTLMIRCSIALLLQLHQTHSLRMKLDALK